MLLSHERICWSRAVSVQRKVLQVVGVAERRSCRECASARENSGVGRGAMGMELCWEGVAPKCLASKSILNHVRLNNAAGTIIEHGSRAEFRREVEAELVLIVCASCRSMHGIPQLVSAEGSAQTARCLLLGLC